MDRSTQFISIFWKTLFELFKTKFDISITYHSLSDGQIKQTNKTIKDMIKIFTFEKQNNLDILLRLVEFLYNNFINISIKVILFYLIYEKYPLITSNFIMMDK